MILTDLNFFKNQKRGIDMSYYGWENNIKFDEMADGVIRVTLDKECGYLCDKDAYLSACEKTGLPPVNDIGQNKKYPEIDMAANGNQIWFAASEAKKYLSLAMPELFEKEKVENAVRELKNDYPDIWEKWQGKELAPGESKMKDYWMFLNKHKNDYIAVPCTGRSINHKTQIVMATLGENFNPNEFNEVIKNQDVEYCYFIVNSHKHIGMNVVPDNAMKIDMGIDEFQDKFYRQINSTKDLIADNPDKYMITGVDESPNENFMKINFRKNYKSKKEYEMILSKTEWENCDPLGIFCVVKDGNNNWKLHQETHLDIPVVEKQEDGITNGMKL